MYRHNMNISLLILLAFIVILSKCHHIPDCLEPKDNGKEDSSKSKAGIVC